MPLIPGFIDTFQKAIEIHKRKNDDYSGDKGVFFNFDCAEIIASWFQGAKDKVYATLFGIKLARLAVVMYKPANYESVEDSFDDLIVYAGIWKCDYMQRNKKITSNPSDLHTIRETKEPITISPPGKFS